MPTEIVIPRETVNDDTVTVVRLLAPHGGSVKKGEMIAEIETSKANISIEAVDHGFVEWICNEGDEVSSTASIGVLHSAASEVPASRKSDAIGVKADIKTSVAGYQHPVDLGMEESPFPPDTLGRGYPLFSDAANQADRLAAFRKSEPVNANRKEFEQNLLPNEKHTERTYTPPTSPCDTLAANVRYDLYRYAARGGWKAMLTTLKDEPGFAVTLNYRIGHTARQSKLGRKTLLPICRIIQRIIGRRYGISIPFETLIGPGLFFPHWGGVWINPQAVIGANVSIGHDVSIGSAGPNPGGHPIIGDSVYLSPGSRITGPIRIGTQVLISANSLVAANTPDGSILVGVPASVTGHQASNKYITNIHPDFTKTRAT